MKITRPTRDTYQIDLTASEFSTFAGTYRVLRTGFINWLAPKGKRTIAQFNVYLPESARFADALDAARDLTVRLAAPGNDLKGQLVARIGAFCGTLAEGNITEKQADICKAAALGLISFAQESAILSGDECEKWGNAIIAASDYGIARTRANA
jgi:hypothetical protein